MAIEKNIETEGGTTSKDRDWITLISCLIGHGVLLFGLYFHPLQATTFYLSWALYIFSGISMSAGYHRLWAHRSFEVIFPFSLLMLFFGSGAFLGSVISWCRYHRTHHRYIDTEKDPMNRKKGFWYAHIGWRFLKHPSIVSADDLEKMRLIRWQHKYYPLVAILSGLIMPTMIAFAWGDPVGGFLYAGIGRVLALQHAWSLIQSVNHAIGVQHYSDENSAKTFGLTPWLTFGEGYQNFHHLFPQDYRHGYRKWQPDVTKWLIYLGSLVE